MDAQGSGFGYYTLPSSTRPDCLWSRPACVPSAGGMVVCRYIILILPYQRQAQVDSLCEGDSGDKWRLCMYPWQPLACPYTPEGLGAEASTSSSSYMPAR